MERFTSRAKLFEVAPVPETLTGGVLWDDLSRSIWDVYGAKAQKAATYIKKLQLWQTVYLQIKVALFCCVVFIKLGFNWFVLQKILHRYGLFMVGSTMSGLGTEDSDIDMCLLTKSSSNDSRVDAVSNLEQIRDALKNSGKHTHFLCKFVLIDHFQTL